MFRSLVSGLGLDCDDRYDIVLLAHNYIRLVPLRECSRTLPVKSNNGLDVRRPMFTFYRSRLGTIVKKADIARKIAMNAVRQYKLVSAVQSAVQKKLYLSRFSRRDNPTKDVLQNFTAGDLLLLALLN